MTLGPNKLSRTVIRQLVKRPIYRPTLRKYSREKIDWKHASLADLKLRLRIALRKQQDGRCIYCRRILKIERRNAYEDIEHFMDKSKKSYRHWSFSCTNMSIACHACNLEKGTRDLAGPNQALAGLAYLNGQGEFKWIHPYHDGYHDNIEILDGWAYTVKATAPNPNLAQALIDDLKLTDVPRIEGYFQEIKSKLLKFNIWMDKCFARGLNARAQALNKASFRYLNDTPFG